MYRIKTFVKFLFEVFSTTNKHQEKIYLVKRSDIDELINDYIFDTVVMMVVIAKSVEEAIALWPTLFDPAVNQELAEECIQTFGQVIPTNVITSTIERMYVHKEQLIVYELGISTYKDFISPIIMVNYLTE